MLFVPCTKAQQQELRLTNLAHLNHLYEEIRLAGKAVAVVHIYCEYPDYRWVGDEDEGIACVDDGARAAVFYLRHFEVTGDTSSLRRARRLIDFCRVMQADDGLFHNFLFADHTINHSGNTSKKSLGWWTARALWAMGEGYRIWKKREPPYAALLEAAIHKTFFHLDTLLAHYPAIDTIDGFLAPRWLLYNSAADATSELMLGLANYAQASQEQRPLEYLKKFSQGLLAMQINRQEPEARSIFLSWKNVWHGWGNSQTQALALAHPLLQDERIIHAITREVEQFYPYWIKAGGLREIEFANVSRWRIARVDTFQQIAYALRPMIVGALRLAEISNNPRHAELAGELATWFFGNNLAATPMYDPKTGRGYDGINSRQRINRNAGAESTIEALMSILAVEAHPLALRRLQEYLRR